VATTVRGREVPFSFRVAFASVGGSNFELVAPREGESIYVGHLEANGEGFHHTCVAYPTREAMREARAELVRQEREMVQSADLGELGEFCYFDIPEMGALLELLYVTELPPPRRRSASSVRLSRRKSACRARDEFASRLTSYRRQRCANYNEWAGQGSNLRPWD
jgi:hypothetical protein